MPDRLRPSTSQGTDHVTDFYNDVPEAGVGDGDDERYLEQEPVIEKCRGRRDITTQQPPALEFAKPAMQPEIASQWGRRGNQQHQSHQLARDQDIHPQFPGYGRRDQYQSYGYTQQHSIMTHTGRQNATSGLHGTSTIYGQQHTESAPNSRKSNPHLRIPFAQFILQYFRQRKTI